MGPRPCTRRARAWLLLTLFLGAGTSLPSPDALLFHWHVDPLAGRVHVEPAGGCTAHGDHCTLGRTPPGSRAAAPLAIVVRRHPGPPAATPPAASGPRAAARVPRHPFPAPLRSTPRSPLRHHGDTTTPTSGRWTHLDLERLACIRCCWQRLWPLPQGRRTRHPLPRRRARSRGRVTDYDRHSRSPTCACACSKPDANDNRRRGQVHAGQLPSGTYGVAFSRIGYAPLVRRVTIGPRTSPSMSRCVHRRSSRRRSR